MHQVCFNLIVHAHVNSYTHTDITGTLNVCRRSDPGTGGYGASPLEEDHALLEFLNKDEENFPSLEASAQVKLFKAH